MVFQLPSNGGPGGDSLNIDLNLYESSHKCENVKRNLQSFRLLIAFHSFGQVAVIVHFVLLALLWVTRDLGGIGGWGDIFDDR